MEEPRLVALSHIPWAQPRTAGRLARLHAVDERGFRYFSGIQGGVEIHRRPDGLYDCWRRYRDRVELDALGVTLPEAWAPQDVFILVPSATGRHRVGGSSPRGFVMPRLGSRTHAFQHVATIDGRDPHFRWLGVSRLHVIYPTRATGFGIDLDMRKSLAPRVMRKPELYWPSEEPSTQPIVYRAQAHAVSRRLDVARGSSERTFVTCGIPMWCQWPEWPRCPRTGEDMRFVCQIESSRRHRMTRAPAHVRTGDRFLLLGDMGTLYVFFHPGSRVMHVVAQF